MRVGIVLWLAAATLIGTRGTSAQPVQAPASLLSLQTTVGLGPRHGPDPSTARRPRAVGTAYLVAVAHTLVPLGAGSVLLASDESSTAGGLLTFYALIVGPAGGQLYADDMRGATIGSGLRLGGALVYSLGILSLIGELWGDEQIGGGVVLLVAGTGLYVGATVWNLVSVPGSVRQYNERRGFTVRPALDARGQAGVRLALAL